MLLDEVTEVVNRPTAPGYIKIILQQEKQSQHGLKMEQLFLFISFFVYSSFNSSHYCLIRVTLESTT